MCVTRENESKIQQTSRRGGVDFKDRWALSESFGIQEEEEDEEEEVERCRQAMGWSCSKNFLYFFWCPILLACTQGKWRPFYPVYEEKEPWRIKMRGNNTGEIER